MAAITGGLGPYVEPSLTFTGTVTGANTVTAIPSGITSVTGSTSIAGGSVSQAGAWGVTATPSGTNTVTGSVSISGTPTVALSGGSVSISGTPTVALSGASTVTATIGGTQTVTGINVTPTAGAHTIVSTANSAVTVFSPGINGGFVKNPNGATTLLFVDMVNAATTVEGGTNRALMPGEIFMIPNGIQTSVTANAADSVHAFVAVKW